MPKRSATMTGQSVLCMPKDRPPSSVASVTAHSCALASASIDPSMQTLPARKNVVRWMPWTRPVRTIIAGTLWTNATQMPAIML